MNNNIKFWREIRGYSQEDLARLINVSAKTIYNIEKGKDFSVKNLIKIKKVLDVPSFDNLISE